MQDEVFFLVKMANFVKAKEWFDMVPKEDI